MKNYFIRYMAVAMAAILLVAGSTRALAMADRAGGLVHNLRAQVQAQVSHGLSLSDSTSTAEPSVTDVPTDTAEPSETLEPTETAEPTETVEPTETAEPTEVEDQNDDSQGQDQDSDDAQDQNSNSQEAFGTVEQMNGTSWVISGVTVQIDSNTEIKGTIVIGDSVKYEFRTNPDGSLTATEIKLADSNSNGDDNSGSGSSGSGSDNGGQQGGGGSDDGGGGDGGGD